MIIDSILDNDLYVFSVSYVFFKNFPDASGVMEFRDRNNTVYTNEFSLKPSIWFDIFLRDKVVAVILNNSPSTVTA